MTRVASPVLRYLFLIMLVAALSLTVENASAVVPTSTTPIKHFIVLMQENHSFDNYFGTYPGADGIPPGTCIPVDPTNPQNTECVKPFHIGDNDVQPADLDHSSSTSQLQYNDGAMNGFVSALNRRNQDGRLAMGYYDDRDIPYYWNIADQYVLFDRFFSSASDGSLSNHIFWVAGAPANTDKSGAKNLDNLTTIFDRLQQRGVSWKFYVQNYDPNLNYRTVDQYPGNRASQVVWVPLLSFDRFIDNPELSSHIVNLDEYYTDLAQNTLPAVAYIVPSGPSEHPPSNIQSGERFVRTLIQSLMTSESWSESAFLLAYDDWGGWYDHVSPPQIDASGYGFRVPVLLISPYAKQGYIDHTQLDFTSILKFLEENYQLQPLAERDANANSLSGAFDFSQPPRASAFIPSDRNYKVPKAEPKRWVIYVAYGVAVLLAGAGFCAAIAMRHHSLGGLEDPG